MHNQALKPTKTRRFQPLQALCLIASLNRLCRFLRLSLAVRQHVNQESRINDNVLPIMVA